jgi:hypothetical protein
MPVNTDGRLTRILGAEQTVKASPVTTRFVCAPSPPPPAKSPCTNLVRDRASPRCPAAAPERTVAVPQLPLIEYDDDDEDEKDSFLGVLGGA